MRCFLNDERVCGLRRERGREFQVAGAEFEKDLFPKLFRENFCGVSRKASWDLSVLAGVYGMTSLER